MLSVLISLLLLGLMTGHSSADDAYSAKTKHASLPNGTLPVGDSGAPVFAAAVAASPASCGTVTIEGTRLHAFVEGTYVQESVTCNGKPSYKRKNAWPSSPPTTYLYYATSSTSSTDEYWIVGRKRCGADQITLYRASSESPDLPSNVGWKEFSSDKSDFISSPNVRASCQNWNADSLCDNLILERSVYKPGTMGVYQRDVKKTCRNRPLYHRVWPEDPSYPTHLFYLPTAELVNTTTNIWAVGPGSCNATVFSALLDSPLTPDRPSNISWREYHEKTFKETPSLAVKCIDTSASWCSRVEISDSKSHQTEEGVYSVIKDSYCPNSKLPVYKRTRAGGEVVFLYYVAAYSYWVVGDTKCSTSAYIAVQYGAVTPDRVVVPWVESISGVFVRNPNITVTCTERVEFPKLEKTTTTRTPTMASKERTTRARPTTNAPRRTMKSTMRRREHTTTDRPTTNAPRTTQRNALQDTAVGEWKTPSDCRVDRCEYRVNWTIRADDGQVDFHIRSKQRNYRWIGLGFTKDKKMDKIKDVIIAWVDYGNTKLFDGFISSYSGPQWDSSQDVTLTSMEHSEGILDVQFTRDLDTGDSDDANLKDECYFLVLPVGGGYFTRSSDTIRKHRYNPVFSKEEVCFKGTGSPPTKPAATTAQPTTTTVRRTRPIPKEGGTTPQTGRTTRPTPTKGRGTTPQAGGTVWACDFEGNMTSPPCNMDQLEDEAEDLGGKALDWRLHSGPTKSKKTGPDSDHTPGAGPDGKYFYMEVSGLRSSESPAEAEFRSPDLKLDRHRTQPACLSFWYYMLGEDVGELKVRLIMPNAVMWAFKKTGDQKQDRWMNAKVELPARTERIGFVATHFRANEPYGDIAVDDIAVSIGRCDGVAQSSTSSISATTTSIRTTPKPPPPTTTEQNLDACENVSGQWTANITILTYTYTVQLYLLQKTGGIVLGLITPPCDTCSRVAIKGTRHDTSAVFGFDATYTGEFVFYKNASFQVYGGAQCFCEGDGAVLNVTSVGYKLDDEAGPACKSLTYFAGDVTFRKKYKTDKI